MRLLAGKIALVTGAGSGLGRAISTHLARLGGTVIASDINRDTASETCALIAASGGTAESVATDVTNQAEMGEMIEGAAERYGKIDFLFNNAGYAQNGEFQDLPLEGFRHAMDVNFWGVVYGTMSAYEIMMRQGHGTIANVMSLAGLLPGGLMTGYTAAKHAGVGFTLGLRSEARQYGINVVAVCPGYLDTPMHESAENVSEYVRSHDREYLSKRHVYPSAGRVVAHLVRGVVRNRAIVISPPVQKVFWWLYRVAPALVPWSWARIIRGIKKKEAAKAAGTGT